MIGAIEHHVVVCTALEWDGSPESGDPAWAATYLNDGSVRADMLIGPGGEKCPWLRPDDEAK
jgi:hypothetical protein